jgi:hypothetical protein
MTTTILTRKQALGTQSEDFMVGATAAREKNITLCNQEDFQCVCSQQQSLDVLKPC